MDVIENVNIEDVFPLVDEFGNNLATRDYDIKENQEYVHELARSMRSKGIPDEMVTLVRDGGIFRIVAGNSRVMAMRELGTKTFPAVVKDEASLKDVIEIVVRTNTKKKYEALEESAFVRQLGLFGDDEYVSEVSGMAVEDVAKVRRATEAVSDAADDMSLLRLIAIGEFADDAEAVEALTNCSEREFQSVAKRFRNRRDKEAAYDELGRQLEERGIPLRAGTFGYDMICNINKIEMLPADLPDGCCAVRYKVPGFYMIMCPASKRESVETDEQSEERAECEALDAMNEEQMHNRRIWLAEKLQEQHMLPNLSKLVQECATRHHTLVQAFIDDTDTKRVNVGQSEIILMVEKMNNKALSAFRSNSGTERKDGAESLVTLIDTMRSDGYEPDEDDERLYQKATDIAKE